MSLPCADGVDAALAARMAYGTVRPMGGLTRKVALAWQQVHVEKFAYYTTFNVCDMFRVFVLRVGTICGKNCLLLRLQLTVSPFTDAAGMDV